MLRKDADAHIAKWWMVGFCPIPPPAKPVSPLRPVIKTDGGSVNCEQRAAAITMLEQEPAQLIADFSGPFCALCWRIPSIAHREPAGEHGDEVELLRLQRFERIGQVPHHGAADRNARDRIKDFPEAWRSGVKRVGPTAGDEEILVLRHSGRRSRIHRLILMAEVLVRDVGPRDGLQAEAPLPVAKRAELVERLIDAGLRQVEVASFVRDELVPAMAGAEDVVAMISVRPHVTRYGLVANLRGAQRGAATSLDAFTFTLSLSPEYSHKNTRRDIRESLKVLAEVVSAVERPVDAVISCAFGSPFDDIDVLRDLPKLVVEVRRRGATDITLADTTGMATPRVINEVLQSVGSDVGIHLHETRGTALLNAYAALRLGVRRFDTSIGGIGGSPFAPNASGNLATESLVRLLHDEGFATGASLDGLLATATWLQEVLGHDLPSPLLQLSAN